MSEDYSSFSIDTIEKSLRDMLDQVKAETGASEEEINQAFSQAARRIMDINMLKEPKVPRVVNGHVLKECDCGDCPICTWGAGICENCNAAEVELEDPCAGF